MSHAGFIVEVDAQLRWLVRCPELLVGATRAASMADVARACHEFDAMTASLDHARPAGNVAEALARALVDSLGEPPELPFIGAPFGGEDGTD